jgi:hypothetical protein
MDRIPKGASQGTIIRVTIAGNNMYYRCEGI